MTVNEGIRLHRPRPGVPVPAAIFRHAESVRLHQACYEGPQHEVSRVLAQTLPGSKTKSPVSVPELGRFKIEVPGGIVLLPRLTPERVLNVECVCVDDNVGAG